MRTKQEDREFRRNAGLESHKFQTHSKIGAEQLTGKFKIKDQESHYKNIKNLKVLSELSENVY